MKLKTLIVTVAVLAVLSVVAFIARRPAPPTSTDARLNQPLVDPQLVEKAAKLRISDGGKTLELIRQPDGTWRVPSYYDMRADFSKLSGFVGNLTDAKIQRLVTSNPKLIARLEFKDTKIELLDSADKPLFSATLGKNAETGGGRFVKFGDEQKAYLTNLSAWLDTEPKNWADAELLNVKPEEIAKVEIPFESRAVTVSRTNKDDPWTANNPPAGQKVKADKISSVLSSVANLRFSDTSDRSDPNVAAAKEDLRTFKLTTFDGKTVTVALGRKPEQKKLKPPAPSTDGKTGPAALGSVSDLAKQDTKKSDDANDHDHGKDEKADENKSLEPEFETIPAGPVFAFVTHSDPDAPINTLMQKRAFQVSEYTFTGLPQKADELFEPAPPPAEPAKEKAPADEKKSAAK